MAKIDFGGVEEEVVTREEFPVDKALQVLRDETIAVIGYGVQGPAQALNMKDNGFNVIVGQSSKFQKDWNRAVADGWVPGETLFDIEEAAKRGTIIQMLVSDAAQKSIWPAIKACLNEGDALYFSHGFSIVYKDQTDVIPPENIDVILVAPKGSGASVRKNFLDGSGINSSFAVHQDFTGRARERARSNSSFVRSTPVTVNPRRARAIEQRPGPQARSRAARAWSLFSSLTSWSTADSEGKRGFS